MCPKTKQVEESETEPTTQNNSVLEKEDLDEIEKRLAIEDALIKRRHKGFNAAHYVNRYTTLRVTFNQQPFYAEMLAEVSKTFGRECLTFLKNRLVESFNKSRTKYRFAKDIESVIASTVEKELPFNISLYDELGFHTAFLRQDLRERVETVDMDYYLTKYINDAEEHPYGKSANSVKLDEKSTKSNTPKKRSLPSSSKKSKDETEPPKKRHKQTNDDSQENEESSQTDVFDDDFEDDVLVPSSTTKQKATVDAFESDEEIQEKPKTAKKATTSRAKDIEDQDSNTDNKAKKPQTTKRVVKPGSRVAKPSAKQQEVNDDAEQQAKKQEQKKQELEEKRKRMEEARRVKQAST